ncbi:hypothetical protein ACFO3O_12800 [Dokdonia ponticola]|uniref:Uncharacterized protein n=1 Tax=Dokdonia ponticola TaxID=2041041 RepID=A0ABV9HXZ7_9FLAO
MILLLYTSKNTFLELGIFDWIRNKETKTEFEKTFADLNRMSSLVPSAGKTFDLLKSLNSETTESQTDSLISELNKIQYASNTNSTFYFYFPIVTHILYFKPECEKDILEYLIGPNFANGTTNTEEMISLIQGAMKYKLSENKEYLTKESQNWIMNTLPKLENEVERELQKCWKGLNE